MFMSPVISGSTRVSNDTFGLMPLNALNGSESTFPMTTDVCTVPPTYEESILCGSLAFDVQRDSRQPSPTTPRSRKGDNSPRNFKMSPTPSRVAPASPRDDDVMVRLTNEQNTELTDFTLHSLFIPRTQTDKAGEDGRSKNFHRSNSDPPPAYDDVVHMSRDVTSCPSFQRSQNAEYSATSGNISIISTSGVNGVVLSEIEQSAQIASTKSRKKKRMRHAMCGCVIVLLVVAISVVLVLMTSGSLTANGDEGQTGETTTSSSMSESGEKNGRAAFHMRYHKNIKRWLKQKQSVGVNFF